MLIFAAMLLVGVPQSVPVRLVCTLTDSQGVGRFDIQVNEQAGTVSYFAHRTQMAVTKKAIFTPDFVAFNSFTIDRHNLTFRRDNDPGDVRLFGWAARDNGQCKVDDTKRAF